MNVGPQAMNFVNADIRQLGYPEHRRKLIRLQASTPVSVENDRSRNKALASGITRLRAEFDWNSRISHLIGPKMRSYERQWLPADS